MACSAHLVCFSNVRIVCSGKDASRFSVNERGTKPGLGDRRKRVLEKYNLDVELIYLDGGARTVTALLSGSVQLVIGSDIAATTAIIQGANLVRLGVTTNSL